MFSDNFVNIMEEKSPSSLKMIKKGIKRLVKVHYGHVLTIKNELRLVVWQFMEGYADEEE